MRGNRPDAVQKCFSGSSQTLVPDIIVSRSASTIYPTTGHSTSQWSVRQLQRLVHHLITYQTVEHVKISSHNKLALGGKRQAKRQFCFIHVADVRPENVFGTMLSSNREAD